MKFTDDELALLAHFGDSQSLSELWENSVPQAIRVTRKFANKYTWIDHDDLVQSVLLNFPKFIERFKPGKSTINRYLYYCFYFAALDYLRAEDPLGMKFPQKGYYPEWRRLGDLSDDPDMLENVIQQSMRNLDLGYS